MSIAKLAILVALGTAVACGDRTPPVLGEVTLAQPSEHTPLAALLTFSTDEPGRVSLEIADGDRTWSVTPVDDYHTDHEIPVLGLRPDRSHDVTVVVSDEAGNESSAPPVTIRTDPLPENFPPLDVRVSKPAAMEPGVTLFGMFRWPDGGRPDQPFGLLIAVDAAGDVVWYHRTDEAALLAIRLQNGNLLYNTSPGGARGALVEIDLLGNVKHTWRSRAVSAEGLEDAILVDVDSIHHDVLELPSGNFAVFSSEIRTFENYPTSAEDPDASRATVAGATGGAGPSMRLPVMARPPPDETEGRPGGASGEAAFGAGPGTVVPVGVVAVRNGSPSRRRAESSSCMAKKSAACPSTRTRCTAVPDWVSTMRAVIRRSSPSR